MPLSLVEERQLGGPQGLGVGRGLEGVAPRENMEFPFEMVSAKKDPNRQIYSGTAQTQPQPESSKNILHLMPHQNGI